MKRIGAFILALVLVPLTASAGTTGSIAGTVLGTGTGSPIANAKVTAISGAEIQVARTDARGDFAFVSLTPGTYIVEIERDGYATAIRVGVHVAADSTARLALAISPSTAVIAIIDGRHLYAPGLGFGPGHTSDVYFYGPYQPFAGMQAVGNGLALRLTPGVTFGPGTSVAQ